MLIQNYCFADGTPAGEYPCSGTPDARIPALMGKWIPYLSGTENCFFDMPLDPDNRFFLLAIPACGKGAVLGFSLPREFLLSLPSCYPLYHAFAGLNTETLRETAEKHLALKLELTDSPVEPAPIAAAFTDLQGWQMVGNTDKALRTVARMLPQAHPETWFKTFFFAVKPSLYANDFTTVVCDEVPDGVWKKLKTFHSEFTTPSVFHQRMHALLRRRMRPRIILTTTIAAILLLLFSTALLFSIRRGWRMKHQRDYWRMEYRRLNFLLEKHDRSLEESAGKIRRLQNRIRTLEGKKKNIPTAAGSVH